MSALGLIGSVTNRGAQTYISGIGTLNQPASGSVSISEFRNGPLVVTTFTLTAARISVTDGAGSGSYGSLLLYTLPAGAICTLGARQNYTAFAEGAALTGGAGDAVFVVAVGTENISAAADGILSTNYKDVGSAVQITLSGGTGAGAIVSGSYDNAPSPAFDGTDTAIKFYLNWSGTAATIDANSTIDVTGTITIAWLFLGDD